MTRSKVTAVFVGRNQQEMELVRARLTTFDVLHARTALETIWALQSLPADSLIVLGVSCPHGLANALRMFIRDVLPSTRLIDAYAAVTSSEMTGARADDEAPQSEHVVL